jgi:predicted porin
MKKSLVALAVLGAFAGAASAQSSVTVYGVLDLALKKGNGGTSSNAGALGASKAWNMSQSTTSRLGFRGSEDMGGGLSAQFQIEHRFNPDTGAQNDATTFWNGRSYVQLTSKAMGSIYLGREYAPEFWPALKSDPFGYDGVGQAGGYLYAGFSHASNSGNSVRTNNTLGLKTANMGGLTANVATALSEGSQTGRNDSFNVEYKAGPLYLGGAYAKISGSGANKGDKLFNLAAHYDLGVAKLIGYYAEAKVGGGRNKNKTYMGAATIPLAGGVVKAAYVVWDPAGGNNQVKKLGLGYNYPLSKRTNLYTDFGTSKQDGRTRNSAYSFGVRHRF